MPLLPSFFLIGAARSGTTAIYLALSHHPEVFTPTTKEPNFFSYGGLGIKFRGPGDEETINKMTKRNIKDYLLLYEESKEGQRKGDFSPSYLYIPRASRRIHKFVPDARIICILRNPIDRAFSHYLMLVRDKRATGSFREALKKEPKRIRMGWEHTWHFRSMGFYYQQLQRYYKLFRNEQIRVYIYKDLCEKPDWIIRDICKFIGVNPELARAPKKNTNAGGVPMSTWVQNLFLNRDHFLRRIGRQLFTLSFRGRVVRFLRDKIFYTPSMPSDIRDTLRDTYRDDIRRLQDLIDRDLSHWLDDSG